MSSFGRSRAASGSASNLYRSQSLASLGGDKLVLGEGFRSSYSLSTHRAVVLKELGLNSKSMSKIPKTPRPKRTIDVFNAVIKGLRLVEGIEWRESAFYMLANAFYMSANAFCMSAKAFYVSAKAFSFLLSLFIRLKFISFCWSSL